MTYKWLFLTILCLLLFSIKVSSNDENDDDYEVVDEPHFIQVKFDEDIWLNEDNPIEISHHFFQYNRNKRPIILVQKKKIEEEKYYSVLMLDPDAPSREDPKFADWLHWGLYNIPGELLQYGALDFDEHAASGFKLFDVFAEYNSPTPPKGSGPHRYNVILLMQERPLIQFIPPVQNRANFSLENYLKKYKMKELIRATFTTENI